MIVLLFHCSSKLIMVKALTYALDCDVITIIVCTQVPMNTVLSLHNWGM